MARACCRTAPTRTCNRSPVINYTYARTRPIVERMMKAGDIDQRHGARVRYANPINGGQVLPTMGAYLAMFPKGFKGEDYRSTDGTIFVCIEGKGTTTVDDKVLEWGPNDVFVVPPWKQILARREEGVGAVLDLRPARAGSARASGARRSKPVPPRHSTCRAPPQAGRLFCGADRATPARLSPRCVCAAQMVDHQQRDPARDADEIDRIAAGEAFRRQHDRQRHEAVEQARIGSDSGVSAKPTIPAVPTNSANRMRTKFQTIR